MNRSLLSYFLRFSSCGAAGTVAHYLVLIAAVNVFSVGSLMAAQLGALCGALINYGLNVRFNYRRPGSGHVRAGLKFLTIALAGLLLNGLVVGWLVHALEWHYLAAQVTATALVLLLGFVGNHFWTFAPKPS